MTYEEWYETTLPFQQVSERLRSMNSLPAQFSDVYISIAVVYRRPTIRSAYGVLFLWYDSAVYPVECTGYDASETSCHEVSHGQQSENLSLTTPHDSLDHHRKSYLSSVSSLLVR